MLRPFGVIARGDVAIFTIRIMSSIPGSTSGRNVPPAILPGKDMAVGDAAPYDDI